MTFLGAMILGIANSMAIGYVPQSILTDVTAALPMAMLFLVLLSSPRSVWPGPGGRGCARREWRALRPDLIGSGWPS